MALPVTFGPLTAASMGQLDQNFAATGALTTLQCTATGTNALVLTPRANQPTVNAYGLPNPLKFGFTAAASSTGAVTLEVATFGFLPVYTANGVQATSGTLQTGVYYEVTYTTGAIYNSGNGAWVLSSYQATASTPVSNGSISGLAMANNVGTPNTQIDFSFASACLVSAAGIAIYVALGSSTIDLTTGTVTSTANGMDGESRPASGWVYLYAISTGSGVAGLGTTVSPRSGPPTLPAGYAFYAYMGAMYCDGSSNLKRTRQQGKQAAYIVTAGSNTASYPLVASGSAGTINPTVFTGVSESITAIVPPTASIIKFTLGVPGGTGVTAAVAPTNTFAGYADTTNPVPWYIDGVAGTQPNNQTGDLPLNGTVIFYAASSSDGHLQAIGWTDFVSAA